MAEVWQNGDQYYIVYFVPDTEPPVPLYYEATKAEAKGWSGTQGGRTDGVDDFTVDRQVGDDAILAAGGVYAGEFAEIDVEIQDPFLAWVDEVTKMAEVKPWLNDEGVLLLIAEYGIEGRVVPEGLLSTTSWWKKHNDAERAWLTLELGDPESAAAKLIDNRLITTSRLKNAGVNNASEELVNFMADAATYGTWSDTKFDNQVQAIADPASGIEVDGGLTDWLEGLDTTKVNESTVRDLAAKWLGPVYGDWTDEQVSEWAGKMRHDPDAKTALEGMLKGQRTAMFPAYTDPNATYADIAAPWKSVVNRMWGEVADETSDSFLKIVESNDIGAARKILRTEGLKNGNSVVRGDLVDQLSKTSSQVREVL